MAHTEDVGCTVALHSNSRFTGRARAHAAAAACPRAARLGLAPREHERGGHGGCTRGEQVVIHGVDHLEKKETRAPCQDNAASLKESKFL